MGLQGPPGIKVNSIISLFYVWSGIGGRKELKGGGLPNTWGPTGFENCHFWRHCHNTIMYISQSLYIHMNIFGSTYRQIVQPMCPVSCVKRLSTK